MHRTGTAIHVIDWFQQRPIQVHGDEGGYRVKRGAHAPIFEIEGIVDALHRAHVEIDPLYRLIAGVVDGVRVAQACRSARRPLQHGRALIDRELGFAIEDDEHLFALVVEVGADAALGLNHAAMHEKQIALECLRIEERPIVQRTRAIVHRLHVAILRGVGVGDSLLQREQRRGLSKR